MKINKKNLILAILLPVQILIVQVISQHTSFIEHFYANGIYPYISNFLRILLGWIPFSFGDVLLLILVLWIIRFFYRLIVTRFKNFVSKLIQLLAFLSIIYFCFYFFWGFNYFREPLNKNLNLPSSKYTTQQLQDATKHIIKKLNAVHIQITKNDTIQVIVPYQPKEIYKKSVDAYKNIALEYPVLTYKNSSIKSSLMSWLQTYNGTSGYINPLTGEAHVNYKIPKTGYPATTCHEMAHQIGYAAENEANFIGFLVTISYNDNYFMYSGYRMAFAYCISEVRKRDKNMSKELWTSVNKGIIRDFNASSAFWHRYKNPIEPYIKKGYNSYLKANNQQKGIDSYNYVVDLLISYLIKRKEM